MDSVESIPGVKASVECVSNASMACTVVPPESECM